MSRDFEQEFIQLKLNETPDLWNRIEAGLSEKKVLASGRQYKLLQKPAWRKWGTLAAACICVAIILPALSLVIGSLGGRKNSYSDNRAAAGDKTFSPTNMTNMSENAAPAETYDEEKLTADAEMKLETDEDGLAADLSGAADAALQDYASNDSTVMNNAQALKEKTAFADMAEAEEYVLKDIIVEITEASMSGDEAIYQAEVIRADKDGLLKEGMQICVLCNSNTEYDFIGESDGRVRFEISKRYELSVSYEKNGESSRDKQDNKEPADGRYVVITAGESLQ